MLATTVHTRIGIKKREKQICALSDARNINVGQSNFLSLAPDKGNLSPYNNLICFTYCHLGGNSIVDIRRAPNYFSSCFMNERTSGR